MTEHVSARATSATSTRPWWRRPLPIATISALASSVLWMLSLAVSYAIEDFVCTATASAAVPQPSETLRILLVALNAVLLLLTLLAGVLGFLAARAATRAEGLGVVTFLGYTGAVLAVMYAYSIVLIGIQPLLLEACS